MKKHIEDLHRFCGDNNIKLTHKIHWEGRTQEVGWFVAEIDGERFVHTYEVMPDDFAEKITVEILTEKLQKYLNDRKKLSH